LEVDGVCRDAQRNEIAKARARLESLAYGMRVGERGSAAGLF
jgi:hypothetical protein